jgi:hypothetical protein
MGGSCDAVGPSAAQPSKSEAAADRPPNRDKKEVTLDAALDRLQDWERLTNAIDRVAGNQP